ncbi:MAG TPA: hypothetical protein VFC46_00570 [Humisphaera sp.]|nr:hypothetical protein [Humisphaera sp.]
MDFSEKNAGDLGSLADAGGPCIAPLDAAAEYLRRRMDRVLPLYVLAMAPHAVVAVLLIDAIVAERRSNAETYCIFLVIATLWRWVWLARLQQNVQADLSARQRGPFWKRTASILMVRLFSNFAITWGSLAAGVPAFYGLYVGTFAAPLLLESDEPTITRVGQSLSWIQNSGKRLFRVSIAMTAITILLTAAIFLGQAALAGTVLPSLLGVDGADLNVTIDSWAWRMRLFYLIFLVIDAFWTVAGVFLYYDSQSRRLATDLRVRLQGMMEVQP